MSTFPAVFPPPPNAARYGIAALNLVPTFQTSPTLNPNAREKSWLEAFDPTRNPNQATVKYYYDATGTYQPFVITNGGRDGAAKPCSGGTDPGTGGSASRKRVRAPAGLPGSSSGAPSH